MLSRLRARGEWQFFAALPRASAGLSAAWWGLILAQGLLPAVFAVLIGVLVGAVQRGGSVALPLVGVGAVFVAMQLLAPVRGHVGANLGDRLSFWLHETLLEGATRPAGMAHLESSDLTDDLTMARDFDLGMATPPLSFSMGMIAGGLVEVVVGLAQLAVLTAYRWWAPVLVGGAWALTHWMLRPGTVWDANTGEALASERRAEYTYRIAATPPPAKEVRLFGLSEWTVGQFAVHRRRLVDLRWDAMRLRPGSTWCTVAVLLVSNGLFFLTLAHAAAGSLSMGEVVIFAQAAVGVSALAFGGLDWTLPYLAQGVGAVLGLGAAMESRGGLTSGDEQAAGRPRNAIRFRDVHFCYAGGGRDVLDGLELTIPAGSSLAVVGLNGAGKTTLIKLLCRLYDPTSGSVEIDGRDLRRLDVVSWRKRLAVVFQDFVHYDLPLRDNIAPLGASDDQINAALADAGIQDMTGLDTILARGYDGGIELSGGQWQRVAIARALCGVRQGARVVVLDEPTAQLDVRGEAEIFDRTLARLRGRCTTILVSHRFSTVRHADRICVLEHGRVAELGTHKQLMAHGGRYRQMFDLQASRFAGWTSTGRVEEIDDVRT